MINPGQFRVGNEGFATKKGGHMEYALAHTPSKTIATIYPNLINILSISYHSNHL